MTTEDHVERNRRQWNTWSTDYVASGRRAWSGEAAWGIWSILESTLGVVGDVRDLDTIELGCGTAYWSAWLARAGARPVGVDLSERQLAAARDFQRDFGLTFPLIQANAEHLPIADARFDLALSEYGACIWCDPYVWIPEAARVLRPGGRLIFLCNAPLIVLTWPDEETAVPAGAQLLRPYFGMHRQTWKSDESVEFHLPHGEMLRLLRANGFEVEALRELQPSADPKQRGHSDNATLEWARQWPSEEIWVARLVSGAADPARHGDHHQAG